MRNILSATGISSGESLPPFMGKQKQFSSGPWARVLFALVTFLSFSIWSEASWANNAKFFNITSGGDLSAVSTQTWSKHWTSVVSTRHSSQKMLVLYDREQGQGKSFTYSNTGSIAALSTWTNWQTDWDQVIDVSYGGANSDYNVAFYRRSDGLFKAYTFGSSGGMTLKFQQNIANPTGTLDGWDLVVPGRFGAAGWGILLYRRITATARFLQYNASTNQLDVKKNYVGWRSSWDDIVAGDFSGDGLDDLVLFDADDGTVKVVNFDASWNISSETVVANEKATHGARLAVGEFGGTATRKDFMIYQNDNGAAANNGHAAFWKDTSGGGRTLLKAHGDWSDIWTHLVPVDLGSTRTGFLLYSNQHVIDVQVIAMNTSAGAAPWTAADTTNLSALQAAARKTFAPAGIRFAMTLAANYGVNAELANWQSGQGDRAVADAWVAANVSANVIPITLATLVSGGGGCSNRDVEFVRSSWHVASGGKHYAHELGHYFGLPHSHSGLDDRADVETFLSGFASPGLDDMDSDNFTSSVDFIGVRDTLPIFPDVFDWSSVAPVQICDTNSAMIFDAGASNVTMWISDHNVMAYNNCDSLYRLTRDQIRAVRQTLYDERKELIGL